MLHRWTPRREDFFIPQRPAVRYALLPVYSRYRRVDSGNLRRAFQGDCAVLRPPGLKSLKSFVEA